MGPLSAALTTHIGELLYREYVPTVVRVPAPMLCLGNDPLIFLDEDRAIGSGSYSQIAARRGQHPFSIRGDVQSLTRAAVEVVRGHSMIAMPLDPCHAVVLRPLGQFPLPGVYSGSEEAAQLLNHAAMGASLRWLVVPPGRDDAAFTAIYRRSPGLRKADRYRAERGLPLHTDRRHDARSSPTMRAGEADKESPHRPA